MIGTAPQETKKKSPHQQETAFMCSEQKRSNVHQLTQTLFQSVSEISQMNVNHRGSVTTCQLLFYPLDAVPHSLYWVLLP